MFILKHNIYWLKNKIEWKNILVNKMFKCSDRTHCTCMFWYCSSQGFKINVICSNKNLFSNTYIWKNHIFSLKHRNGKIIYAVLISVAIAVCCAVIVIALFMIWRSKFKLKSSTLNDWKKKQYSICKYFLISTIQGIKRVLVKIETATRQKIQKNK